MIPPPTFFLQKGVFSEDSLADTEALIRAAVAPCPVKIVPDQEVMLGSSALRGHRGPFRGSLAMAQRMGRQLPFTDARSWAPALKDYLLSRDYYFLDAASILDRFPSARRMFVRPASGFKEFSGNVFTREKFAEEFHFITQGRNIDPCTICMVSSATDVPPALEWRLVFIDHVAVGGSRYMKRGELSPDPNVPEEVVALASHVAREPYFLNTPDFVLDFAETDRGPRLIEVNAVETSSFYAADLGGIYSAWSRAVLKRDREAESRLEGQDALEKAIFVATRSHRGQTDKAGQPYILHALRVMMMMDTVEGRVAGVLHDVVEDTQVTLGDLRNEGFSEDIVRAVDALSKRPGETRLEAAVRASKNPLARLVKLADNVDNSNLSRIPMPMDKDFRRLEEYLQVRKILESAGRVDGPPDPPAA